jgi:hypothetical protein
MSGMMKPKGVSTMNWDHFGVGHQWPPNTAPDGGRGECRALNGALTSTIVPVCAAHKKVTRVAAYRRRDLARAAGRKMMNFR